MSDSPVLRPMTVDDVPSVLKLNARDVELLSPMDEVRLGQLRTWTHRADVIDVRGQVAGFVLTFGPGTEYDSANYAWFAERFADRFCYLDRIVIAPSYRRRGLGRFVYDQLEAAAAPWGRMVLEVNVQPPNDASLAFHTGRGYVEIGRRASPGHVVAMMVKEL